MVPQVSTFGICKAEMFGDKRVIWKTAEKNSRRIRQTGGQKIQGASQTSPSFQLHGGHPDSQGQHTFLQYPPAGGTLEPQLLAGSQAPDKVVELSL